MKKTYCQFVATVSSSEVADESDGVSFCPNAPKLTNSVKERTNHSETLTNVFGSAGNHKNVNQLLKFRNYRHLHNRDVTSALTHSSEKN